MLVMIKSAPVTDEAARAVKLAREMPADIVLMQNAVYFAEKDRLDGFCGTVYALDEDMKLRGISEKDKGVKEIGYGEMVDIMADEEKVVGMF